MQLCPALALSPSPPQLPAIPTKRLVSRVHIQVYLNLVYACLQSKVNFKLKQMFVPSVYIVGIFRRQRFSWLLLF